jgi:hypothetical protein
MLLPIIFPSESPDRRRRPRLRLAYSVRLQRPGEATATETKTEDVSCEGFFFVTHQRFSPRESLDCELVIPGQDPDWLAERGIVLRCRVEVMRVVPRPDQTYGVACRLADYTVGQVLEEDLKIGLALPA